MTAYLTVYGCDLMCAAIDAGAPQRQRCPESGLWRLRSRVVGRYTDAPAHFAPCTVHTNKIRPYCDAAVFTQTPIGTRPWNWNPRPRDMSREAGRVPTVSPAGYSEGPRADPPETADHKPFDGISVTAGRLTLSYSSTTRELPSERTTARGHRHRI